MGAILKDVRSDRSVCVCVLRACIEGAWVPLPPRTCALHVDMLESLLFCMHQHEYVLGQCVCMGVFLSMCSWKFSLVYFKHVC